MVAERGFSSLPLVVEDEREVTPRQQRESMEYHSLPNLPTTLHVLKTRLQDGHRSHDDLKLASGDRWINKKNSHNIMNQQKRSGQIMDDHKAPNGEISGSKYLQNYHPVQSKTQGDKKETWARKSFMGLNGEKTPPSGDNNPDYNEDSETGNINDDDDDDDNDNSETSVKTLHGGDEHDEEKIEQDELNTEKDAKRQTYHHNDGDAQVGMKDECWFETEKQPWSLLTKDGGCLIENVDVRVAEQHGTSLGSLSSAAIYTGLLKKVQARELTPDLKLSLQKALQKLVGVEAKNIINKLIHVFVNLSSMSGMKTEGDAMMSFKEKFYIGDLGTMDTSETKVKLDHEVKENSEPAGNLPAMEKLGITDESVSTLPATAEFESMCDRVDEKKSPREQLPNGNRPMEAKNEISSTPAKKEKKNLEKPNTPDQSATGDVTKYSQQQRKCEFRLHDKKRNCLMNMKFNVLEVEKPTSQQPNRLKRIKCTRKRRKELQRKLRARDQSSGLRCTGNSSNSPKMHERDAECFMRVKKEKYLDVRTISASCLACSRPTGGAVGGGGGDYFSSGGSDASNHGYSSGKSKDEQESIDSDKDGDDTEKRPGYGGKKKSANHPVLRRANPIRRKHATANIPPINHKAVRKKPDELDRHGEPPGGIVETLGLLSLQNQDLADELACGLVEVNKCLVHCFHHLQNGTEQDGGSFCLNCTVIFSLLQHFGRDFNTIPGQCATCMQLFKLVRFHLEGCCLEGSPVELCDHTLSMCRRIHRQVAPFTSTQTDLITFLWEKLKEFLSRLYGEIPSEQQQQQQQVAPPAPGRKPSLRRKVSARNSTLGKIPEQPTDEESGLQPQNFHSSSSKGTNSQVIISGPGSLHMEHDPNLYAIGGGGIVDTASFSASIASMSSGGFVRSGSGRQSRETSHNSFILRNLTDVPGPLPPRERLVQTQWGISYQQHGCQSLPMHHVTGFELIEQLKSFEDRPVGEKGIGEVVYGTRSRLTTIANHWRDVKEKYHRGERIPKTRREEGVILSEMMSKLQVGKTRYQQDIQWQKISYLGRGVSGKCHLAMDLNSEFKFCVKEMLITNFAEDELVIWSGLDHPNIVKLYGAIRGGDYIYIFAELIDGGCLTEHINNQRQLNQRLSKVMALQYFSQLLNVLVYLESQHVIHEDLKADNILLRRNSSKPGEPRTEVVVADFGLANKLQPGQRVGVTSPIGSQTQWSPEKAASQGYDFRSDVWAVTCILVHIFNGDPPWVQRYGHAALLHFIISNQSPPLDDMPQKITKDIEDLITSGWADEHRRPKAGELLRRTRTTLQLYGMGSSQLDSLWSTVSGPNDPVQMQLEDIKHLLEEETQNKLSRKIPSEHEDDSSTSVEQPPPMPEALNLYKRTQSDESMGTILYHNPQLADSSAVDLTSMTHRVQDVQDSVATTEESGVIGVNKIDSDPRAHIQRFISDSSCEHSATPHYTVPELEIYTSNLVDASASVNVGLLPRLAVFEDDINEVMEDLTSLAVEGSNSPVCPATQSQQDSKSSPDITEQTLDESRIDSGDMFGSGPNEAILRDTSLPAYRIPEDSQLHLQLQPHEPQSLMDVRILARVQPYQLGLYQPAKTTLKLNGNEASTSPSDEVDQIALVSDTPTDVPVSPHHHPVSPKLHIQLPRPGQTKPKPLLMHSSVSCSAFPTVKEHHADFPHRASEPNTALPTVRANQPDPAKTSEILSLKTSPQSPQHSGGSSSQTSGVNSGSPRDRVASTPKSAGSSTYDHQEKEMRSLTLSTYLQELDLDASSEKDLQSWEVDENADNDNNDDMLGDVSATPVDLYNSRLSYVQQQLTPEDNNGSLIKFRTDRDEVITQVRIRDPCKEWLEVITDIAAPIIHRLNYKRFCVYHGDGSIVDMGTTVGGTDISVRVVDVGEVDECQTWYIEDHQFHWN